MDECPFCDATAAVLSNALALARFDKYPVSVGHLLVMTRRHVASYFESTAAERAALLELIDAGKALLDERFSPAGYNIGINVGATAGQTIAHLHVHLIPRYAGDVADPRGGVRGVIPDKRNTEEEPCKVRIFASTCRRPSVCTARRCGTGCSMPRTG
jgi:diadenosine tetraphosphate (Ap4A) HIT family hydrolase